MDKQEKFKMAGIFAIGAAVISYGIFLLIRGKKEEPAPVPAPEQKEAEKVVTQNPVQ